MSHIFQAFFVLLDASLQFIQVSTKEPPANSHVTEGTSCMVPRLSIVKEVTCGQTVPQRVKVCESLFVYLHTSKSFVAAQLSHG